MNDLNASFSDRFHFDNPVYSFEQTSSLVGVAEENQSFNNCQIKNNLNRSNNLGARCSSSMTDDSDNSRMPSTSTSSFKNREADLNNPNIYNSLDDLKSENLYDEIEDKKLAGAGKKSSCVFEKHSDINILKTVLFSAIWLTLFHLKLTTTV